MLRNTLPICAALCLAASLSLQAQNFHVQCAVFTDSVEMTYFTDKGLSNVVKLVDQNGFVRYFVGAYNTREEAENIQRQLVGKGFPGATILDFELQRNLCPKPCHYFSSERLYADDNALLTRSIFFGSGKSSLSAESRKVLDEVFIMLRDKPETMLTVYSYTDSQGEASYNTKLATSRARNARNHLISKGLSAMRIRIKVYGEYIPGVVSEEDEAESADRRHLKRRVVLVVTNAAGEVKPSGAAIRK